MKVGSGADLFFNRELSWLAFNRRVLEEARDESNPLLERLKFAIIVSTNLDEFFMVRVAALKDAVAEGRGEPDPSGLTPTQQLAHISRDAHGMVAELYRTVMRDVLPALAEHGVRLAGFDELPDASSAALRRHFHAEVLPALTPLAIDSSRPFPLLATLSLNLAVLLAPRQGEEGPRLAVVQVPGGLPRLVRPAGVDGPTYTMLEDVVRDQLESLFPGQQILESAAFRVARDSELDLDDEGGRPFLESVQEELRKRRSSRVVRLGVEERVGPGLLKVLTDRLGLAGQDVYRIPGPLDLRGLWPLVNLPALEHLRERVPQPAAVFDAEELRDPFPVLEERDVLLHHPYDSFDPVVALVRRAAADPDVLAIKQTLYRTSGDSPVVEALMRAAEAGKQVTVVVELTARFDEESNIHWARRLEAAGAHVIYGVRGYKTHAKVCLVVRRGSAGIRRYVHLGTGNYNDKTARLYTDFGLMTSDPDIGADASAFFNALTGYSDPPRMRRLVMAPTQLRERFVKLIEREARRAEAGQPAQIRAKMNSLVDPEIIQELYAASRAGVQIRLNVRGVCCLRPRVRGLSENVEVVSIVDRFLEHARIFHFRNGGDEEVYMGSADWMPRNLDKRVELLFPVLDAECRGRVVAVLDAMFADNVKARRLGPDGRWRRRRPRRGEEPYRAQDGLHEQNRRARARPRSAAETTLEPIRSPSGRGGAGG